MEVHQTEKTGLSRDRGQPCFLCPTSGRRGAGPRLALETLAPDLYGSDLILHRPLMVGEMAVVEYELSVPDARGLDHYGQYLLRRVSEALVWVRFHPDAVPPHCEVFQDAGSGEQVTRVHLAGTHEAHHRLSGFGPGFVGVRWSW